MSDRFKGTKMQQFCLIKKDIYKQPSSGKKQFRYAKNGCLLIVMFPHSFYETVIELFPDYISAKSDSRILLKDSEENRIKIRKFINERNASGKNSID